ncbi:hypothetical protein V6N13_070804 [Hibiscus sabdariffa]|uniref:Uncharacterized protein n=1 Tax=Hibiscus sabdariffa TaxID=183260 RepID=A0ABR2TFK4_9ROSI
MAKIALIVLLSFALVLSAKPILGQEDEPKDSVKSELGPAPAGGTAEEATDGVDISSDQLKKIGSEVKEAFQNIEDNVGEEISPEQEEQLLGEFAKDLAPSPGEDDLAPTSDDGDADAPSADGEDVGAPSAEGGDAGAPSAEGGVAGAPSSGASDATSPGATEADSPKDSL